ncbi:hypothetical protein [Aquimarina sp. RZ0]|uniref:hypothetical protein n=1 Tax=Aquimarina sp. RZ0 TaxID=2607730 RepID=UPI0011F3CD60|nr:hypothetical protein [Aquimarina sp. RZ0]KAA1243258.1 hypothetical protein F0000_21885 [Aquimarina sp. RZ0]
MILDTTHYSKSHKKRINDLVEKPFSLVDRFKLRGIGSKRMIIDNVSPNMIKYLNTVTDLNYGNIELRPGGILIGIVRGLQNFTWVIPYYQFYMYKTNGVSIHAQGRFITFKNNRTYQENTNFFNKLSRLKVAYDLKYPHIDTL